MTLDREQIRSYFAPAANSYWQWEERGQVLAWSDGATICYRGMLQGVLARLAPHGLPPLGSVLLLLAACRDNWAEAPSRRNLLELYLGTHYGQEYGKFAADVLTGLGEVNWNRQHFRAEADGLAGLAEFLFEDAPGRFPADQSQRLLEHFERGLAEDDLAGNAQPALEALLHDLGCLRWGLSRFDVEAVKLRLRTGLDELPRAATVEPPPPSSARDLINTLQDDPDLGAVARLAQLLLAAVHLPRAISDPDELPIGGVSDIVNRGPLDRLLLSELAHDDLTLSVRVAMNEALFLRRESPPRTPPRGRRVLLDAGLRTWGVPRVFVAAVGLALAAKSDPKLRVTTFCAAGGAAEPVDFNTQFGLQRQLTVLDHRLHPAESLAALAGASDENEEESDLVLVTTEDTLADREFQRQLHEAGPRSFYISLVSRDGRFQLLQRSFRGSKMLCQAKFDLDEVLKPRPRRPKLLDPSRDPDLPAIFHVPMPLRLSAPIDTERSWLVHPGTVLTYTRDGRLLLWDGPQHGARQIAEGLPQGTLLWCSSAWEDDTLHLVLGKRSQRGLLAMTYDRRLGELDFVTLKLTGEQPQAVIGYQGLAFVFYHGRFDVLSLATGELEVGHEFKRASPWSILYPYFSRDGQGHQQWGILTCDRDASDSLLRPVFTETDKIQLLGMTHCVGHEGPLGITKQGEVLDPATGRLTAPPASRWPSEPRPPYSLIGISRDGQRAVLRGADGVANQTILLHLPSGKLETLSMGGVHSLESPIHGTAKPRTVRSRFSAIGVAQGKQLALVSRRDQLWPISLEVGQREIRFPKSPLSGLLLQKIGFYRVEGTGFGYPLDLAEWPDGSKAWLDGRGLLHLRSSDPNIPQCTLVLTDGPMAGWLDDGCVFGPAYWHQGQTSVPEQVVFYEVLRKFAERAG